MAEKISGVYKITNTITGDFYIGSSKDIKHRWACHKTQSTWDRCPNNPMYRDFQKYGLNKFVFEMLEEVEIEYLKETEQQFIEILKPTYNSNRANGWDVERYKEHQKEYQKEYEKSDKRKKYKKEYNNKYEKSDKRKKYKKEYNNKYHNQLCCYNGEALTLKALYLRFYRAGVEHPTIEAKKYLVLQ